MVGSDHDFDSLMGGISVPPPAPVWEWVTISSASVPVPPGSPARDERVVLAVAPQATKAAQSIDRLLAQIPMRLAGRIASVRFVEKLEGNQVAAQMFVVTYDNRRVLEFANIDTFPTETDIARIALECP